MAVLILNYIDSYRAQVASYEWHATLRLALHEDRTAATEAVAVVLASHPIAPIDCSEDVTGQLGQMLVATSSMIVFLRQQRPASGRSGPSEGPERLFCDLKFALGVEYLVDRIERARAIVTDQHRGANTVALGEHLGATATPTLAIILADQVITEIPVTVRMARLAVISHVITGATWTIITVIVCLEEHLELDKLRDYV